MNRREFLKFIGASLAAAGVIGVSPASVASIADKISPEEKEQIIKLSPVEAGQRLRSFQDMLNEYLPQELLREEMMKRDYLLKNIGKDPIWSGGGKIDPTKI